MTRNENSNFELGLAFIYTTEGPETGFLPTKTRSTCLVWGRRAEIKSVVAKLKSVC